MRILSGFLDLLIMGLVSISVTGGILWKGHLVLKHAADSRRAAIILALVVWSTVPKLRVQSLLFKKLLVISNWALKESSQKLLFYFYLAFAVGLSVLQTYAFRYTMFDVGLFHQILWAVSHGRGFESSISGAGNFLRDHFSPSLVIFAPWMWLTGSAPWSLPVLFSLIIGAVIWTWKKTAQALPGLSQAQRSHFGLAVLLFGIGFDSLWANHRWGFHENAVYFLLSSLGIYFISTQSNIQKIFGYAFMVLSFFSKETLLLQGMMFFLVIAVIQFKFKRSRFLIPFTIAMIFAVVFLAFEVAPKPSDKNYFYRYYGYLGNNLSDTIMSLPHFFSLYSQAIGWPEFFRYVFRIFLPFLFLPLIGLLRAIKKYRTLDALELVQKYGIFVILPSFLSSALSTYSPLRQTGMHYVLELWPVLIFLTLLQLSKFKTNHLLWFWVGINYLILGQDPIGQTREYIFDVIKNRPLINMADKINKAALGSENISIATDELTGAWFASKTRVTRLPETFGTACPEWVMARKSELEFFRSSRQECWFILKQVDEFEQWSLLKSNLNDYPSDARAP